MPGSKEVYLKDYAPPDFLIPQIALDVDIREDYVRVTARLSARRNPKSKNKRAPLVLRGTGQKLIDIRRNGERLSAKAYRLTDDALTIPRMPDTAEVEITSTHNPYKNTALLGLYASGPMLVTQCEAEGFRRITYHPDRPDVMGKFRVAIHADRKKYPALLSNGNLVESGREGKNRHFAIWEDPYLKPTYLFALVAGKLGKVTDTFVTKSGRPVTIEIYVEPGKENETGFALTALKAAMKWDEDRFGLEYDLDRFMIVSTPFFNAGAMENKGLNIFNDSCALGRPQTATDRAIAYIERVVAHEYFHNWTGDRITCRDWFQLSLKEGLTVFRELEFTGDMHSRAVERIDAVQNLRRWQFAEDAGVMAHPVRPDRYQAIENFYTSTVYGKGAELCHMIQTLVGRAGFKKGMRLYVKRHDGQAVTCDDFVKAMTDANRIDLSQFMLWYSQAGTPVLDIRSRYLADRKELRLEVRQSCPPTPGQKKKKPMHIPFAVGLLDDKGRDLIGTRVLSVRKPREEFVFKNIKSRPILSPLRDFSAPVRLHYSVTDEELLFLLAHDSDAFNRWEAGQKLFMKYILQALRTPIQEVGDGPLFDALRNVLHDRKLDSAFKAFLLSPPGENEIGLTLRAQGELVDPEAVFEARKTLFRAIARGLHEDLLTCANQFAGLDPHATDGKTMSDRSLKNLSLSYLAELSDPKILMRVFKQSKTKNMTDQIAALNILADKVAPLRTKALKEFEKRWLKYPLVMDMWFAAQAGARRRDVLAAVKRLTRHQAFDYKNPNRVSALLNSFANNPFGFHARDGHGYRFMAGMIKAIDKLNPHSAGSLCKYFLRWRDYEGRRQSLMKRELRRLAAHKNLSLNCREIVDKCLAEK